MGGPRTSSEAALSGPGKRASRQRDAHTRRAGSLAGTVGTDRIDPPLPGVSALPSPGPAQRPLEASCETPGTPSVPRGGLSCPGFPSQTGVPLFCRAEGSRNRSRQLRTTVAATPCGPQTGLSAALRLCTKGEGMSPPQKRKKESLGLDTETWPAREPSLSGTMSDCQPATPQAPDVTSEVNFQGGVQSWEAYPHITVAGASPR